MLMRKRIAALAAAGMLTCTTALADTSFLPGWSAWEEAASQTAASVTVSAKLNTLVPLDEDRVASLNGLLGHVSLELAALTAGQESWGQTKVLVDGAEVLSLSQRTQSGFDQLNLSCVADTTYTVGAPDGSGLTEPIDTEAATLLFGDTGSFDMAGLNGEAVSAFTAARALLPQLKLIFADHMESTDTTKKISKMGTAAKKNTFAWTADETLDLGAALAKKTEDRTLKALLASLVFTGKQQLTTYEDATGRVLYLSYSGKCGTDAEQQRKVTIEWKLKDDGTEARDDFTLKSPAVSGSDRNTLTVDRVESYEDGKGAMTLDVKYDTRLDKVVNTITVAAELKNTPKDEGQTVTGSVTVKQTDGDATVTWTAEPDLIVSAGEAPMTAEGGVKLVRKVGKNAMLDADLTVSLAEGKTFPWTLSGTTVALDQADAETLTALRSATETAVAQALTAALIKLPQADLTFLLGGLAEDAVQRIMNAWNP